MPTLEQRIAHIVERAVARALKSFRFPAAPAAPRGSVRTPAARPTAEQPEERQWFLAKGIRSLRKKLKLSQVELGKLAGVTPQAVMLWESKTGRLRLRATTEARLQAVRGMGIRDARQALTDMGYVKNRPGRKPAATAETKKAPAKKARASKKLGPRKNVRKARRTPKKTS
ncbi:MAG: helix-turn-helix domain-containing protein [Kiritimatiellae bacterium]|nr:helix-turn-helix domain-containing protein [Kiritimatiellia bacterium]